MGFNNQGWDSGLKSCPRDSKVGRKESHRDPIRVASNAARRASCYRPPRTGSMAGPQEGC